MPALRLRRWTLEEVEHLIDQREGRTPRYELVDGELLVSPGPTGRHQRITFELAKLIDRYVSEMRLGEVRLGPGDVRLAPDSYLEPDIFVIPARDGRRPRAADVVDRLLLAVEVLSPGSARHDRITKRRYYQLRGVPEYWVVDGEAQAFEIWNPGDDRATLVDGELAWRPDGAVAPFELSVGRFFASVADDA